MSGTEGIVARFRNRLGADDQQIWDRLLARRTDWGDTATWEAATAASHMPALRRRDEQDPKEVALIDQAFSYFESEVPPLDRNPAVRLQGKAPRTLGSMPPQFSSVGDYIRFYGGDPTKAIKSILIANNGMAAVKGIRSLRQWAYDNLGDDHALEIVVMATTEDLKANAAYIDMADRYVEVPGGTNNNNYANVGLIVKTAREQGVDAVWPGWGHASENPALPRELAKVGLIFMGPSEKPMMALGDKIGANLVAQSRGVSMIPWSGDGLTIDYGREGIPDEVYQQATVRNAAEAKTSADRIGYPVMIKASGTGGGRGMRKVLDADGIESAFTQVLGESAGSPIFVMKLASSRSRHIEIQVVADGYGNAVALYERDCSVQRRHQKIIEEGPAIGAPEEVRRAMRDQAVALAKEVGYQGMGTVEFMYDPETGEFYFLELNSRLQVEHPVTEGITGINLPGVQLAISMGVPLHRIPEIRKLFDKDPTGNDPIDFSTIHDVAPKGHVIAVRITAENTDKGFTLTAGSVQDIRFEPPPHVWGYFSVGPRSEVHTLADSQIGHIFAQGATREEARRRAVIALRNLTVRGEIRTNREMLITLLESEEFKTNQIDTSWLDGLISAKKTAEKPDRNIAVVAGALYQGAIAADETVAQYVSLLQTGHVPAREALKTNFDVELIYDGIKYPFVVTRIGFDRFIISLKGEKVEVQIRKQTDGGYLVTLNGMAHVVYAQADANGLRVEIDGKTCLFTKEYDPTQIRNDMPGKLTQYLVPDGSQVTKNMAIAMIEAMKMQQEVRAPEAGVIHHVVQAGRDFTAGGLIATLDLPEGFEVQRAVELDHPIGLAGEEAETGLSILKLFQSAERDVLGILNGYGYPEEDFDKALERVLNNLWLTLYNPFLPVQTVEGVMESLQGRLPSSLEGTVWDSLIRYSELHREAESFPTGNILEAIEGEKETLTDAKDQIAFDNLVGPLIEAVTRFTPENWPVSVFKDYLREYLAVEKRFQRGKKYDEVVRELRTQKDNMGGWDKVYEVVLSHSNLAHKNKLLLKLLDHVSQSGLVDRLSSELADIAGLEGSDYEEVSARARTLLVRQRLQTYESRKEELGKELRLVADGSRDKRRAVLRQLISRSDAIFDILFPYFSDDNPSVRRMAMEVYVRRAYRLYPIKDFQTDEGSDFLKVQWTYGYLREGAQKLPRQGMTVYFKSLEELEGNLSRLIRLYGSAILNPELDNSLTIAFSAETPVSDERLIIARLGGLLAPYQDALASAGAGRVTFVVGQPCQFPFYYTYRRETSYQEDPNVRHIEPSLAFQLEMRRLSQFDHRYHTSENRQIHVYQAVERTGSSRAGSKELDRRLFARAVVRGATVSQGLTDRSLEVPEVEKTFVAALDELELALRTNGDKKPELNHIFLNILPGLDLEEAVIEDYMRRLALRHASRLRELKVNEVEVKLVLNGEEQKRAFRYFLTNPTGSLLRIDGYVESRDEETGRYVFRSLKADDPGIWEGKEVEAPYEPLNAIERKRILARSDGTSYVYDFPVLLQNVLRTAWNDYASLKSNDAQVPMWVIEKKELVLNREGELEEVERPDGQNTIGMVAWKITLVTPEAPQGRDVILIANDITHQKGSFSVQEDRLYQKASELARREGIPRIFIAANVGARMGMANEIKSVFRTAEKGEGNERKLDYFYLTPEDYAKYEKSVIAERIEEGEETRYKIIAVVGKEDGINQENLRGSGLIAGETSRAYDETFTLTYVSGINVGIGSYVTRLGQRVIQRDGADIILTGYEALNALLKQTVYQSNRELGGTPIMFPNGITHRVVDNDLEGIGEIIRWISYVPVRKGGELPLLDMGDPIDRDVGFVPYAGPYDPRQFIEGVTVKGATIEGATDSGDRWVSGFFDRGSFTETLGGWGKTVVTGRARLGGIPMGVVAFDTRLVERKIPADPGDRTSAERIEKQAGQVWYPDSSFKTAQTIADFDREGLPLMIFINVRGFSGGTRDMFFEVLKYGSYIVDNLRNYKQPIFIYLPPSAELRGGSWVVVDPMINPDKIRFYADPTARGGVLEPAGLQKIKYKDPDLIRTMHRLDEELQDFDRALTNPELMDAESKRIRERIKKREADLLDYYRSVAEAFADLHDKPERMEAKGVIDGIVPWKESRTFFHHELQRRLKEESIKLKEESIKKEVLQIKPDIGKEELDQLVADCLPLSVEDRQKVYDKLHAEQMRRSVEELVGKEDPDTLTGALEAGLRAMDGTRALTYAQRLQDMAARILGGNDPTPGSSSGSGGPKASVDLGLGIGDRESGIVDPRASHNARVWAERDEIHFVDNNGAALQVQPETIPEIIPDESANNNDYYVVDLDESVGAGSPRPQGTAVESTPHERMSRMAGQYRVLRTRTTSTGTILKVMGR